MEHHMVEDDNNKLNKAICDWMGWVEFPSPDYNGGILMPYKWVLGDDKRMELPSYTTDLNEMHQAEKKLSREVVREVLRKDDRGCDITTTYTQLSQYWNNLLEVVAEDLGGWKDHCIQALGEVVSATALQRAKALAIALKLKC